MITVINRITINQSVNRVFDFISNLENIPFWNDYSLSVKKIQSVLGPEGAFYHQLRLDGEELLEVTEIIPNRTISYRSSSKESISFFRKIICIEIQEGKTRVADYFRMDLEIPWFIEPMRKIRIKKRTNAYLWKLKELLEHQIQ